MRYSELTEATGQPFIRAYHGTTHDFDRFRSRSIGKGEGFQSFGYGLYFAENYEVARYYADKLGAAKPPEDQHAEVIYEINILASPDMLLNWDARMNAQSDYVRKALGEDLYQDEPLLNGRDFYASFPDVSSSLRVIARNVYLQTGGDLAAFAAELHRRTAQATDQAKAWAEAIIAHVRDADHSTGRIVKRGLGMHFLDHLRDITGSPRAASQWLRGRGIRGIVYLDQGSRDEATVPPTSNYVVFDARWVRVVGKQYPRVERKS